MRMNKTTFKLSGFISEFPLIDVIQFLGMTGKNGCLHIFKESEDESSSLYFSEGNLVHARSNGSEGLETFYTVLAEEKGYFEFASGEEPDNNTIDKPINILLLESQKRLDEIKHVESRLPAEQATLFIVPNIPTVPALTPYEWRIISLINGRRSIKRIYEKMGDPLTAKFSILELLEKGLVSTVSEDSGWKSLVPLLKPSSELKTDRAFPPLRFSRGLQASRRH